MDCPDQEKIQAVILEEATEPERSELIEHIEQCSFCQETYHQYTVLFKGIESVVDNEECVPWQEEHCSICSISSLLSGSVASSKITA